MFIGDFNIPEYNSIFQENAILVKNLNTLINLYNLESINNMWDTLNLCLTNFGKYNINRNKSPSVKIEKTEGLVKPDPHHPPLLINIELTNTTNKHQTKTDNEEKNIKSYNFKKADFTEIENELKKTNWYSLLCAKDKTNCNNKVDIFYTQIKSIIDKYVPTHKHCNSWLKFPKRWSKNTIKLYKIKERLPKNKFKTQNQKYKYNELRKTCKKIN